MARFVEKVARMKREARYPLSVGPYPLKVDDGSIRLAGAEVTLADFPDRVLLQRHIREGLVIEAEHLQGAQGGRTYA